jgi:hypothetical protein
MTSTLIFYDKTSKLHNFRIFLYLFDLIFRTQRFIKFFKFYFVIYDNMSIAYKTI